MSLGKENDNLREDGEELYNDIRQKVKSLTPIDQSTFLTMLVSDVIGYRLSNDKRRTLVKRVQDWVHNLRGELQPTEELAAIDIHQIPRR